jgi:hypothetical protein
MKSFIEEAEKHGYKILSDGIVMVPHAAAGGARPRNTYAFSRVSRDLTFSDEKGEVRPFYKLNWKATAANDLYMGEVDLGSDMDGVFSRVGQEMKNIYEFLSDKWDDFPVACPDPSGAQDTIHDVLRECAA